MRLLIIDDSPADAELAVEHLRGAGLHVEALRVSSASEIAEALADLRPDAILADHGLPGLSSLEALRVLRDSGDPTPFIVVAAVLDDESTVACMRAGADDFVLKSHLDRLAPALERALALRAGLKALSSRQLEVLRLVAEGLTTPKIAERLGISLKTVETHRSAMMSRLDIHQVAGLVRYAIRVGLLPPGG